MPDVHPQVTDNVAQNRYEVAIGDEVGVLDYRRKEGTIILVHTEVPEALRGRGIGTHLARHALDEARKAGLDVVVRCPFVTSWLKRHREYDDIVVARVVEDGTGTDQPPRGPR